MRVVFIGDSVDIPFAELIGRSREAKYRLRGLRLVHTHTKNPELSQSDLVTLLNERLDFVGLLEVKDKGAPGRFQVASIVPPNSHKEKWQITTYNDLGRIDQGLDEFIRDIESGLEQSYYELGGKSNKEGVMLVGFHTKYRSDAQESVDELASLAESADKVVLDTTVQIRRNIDPRYLVGKGKLREIILSAQHVGAERIIFDVELTPAQVKSISEETDLEVMDRTQLILQIFAKHATTSEGKLQVRLAELRYNLPRLVGRGIELSQLGGGIGTRGPGEKKLEEQRRKIRKQIDQLEKQIKELSTRREHTRKKRIETGIPTVTFVGYTNVGKSTLFNLLTKSGVIVENKLFSTLSPTTRKIRLPGGKDILVTDTVGFISDLPHELISAFKATLEELGGSSLLLHVADASDPLMDNRIESVEKILDETGYGSIPRLLVFNKGDLVSGELAKTLRRIYGSPVISALKKDSIPSLLGLLEEKLGVVPYGSESQQKIAL